MSDKQYIKNDSGKVVGTIESTPYSSTSSGSETPFGELFGLAIIGFLGGALATWLGGGVLIGLILKLTTGSAATAFDKSLALTMYGGLVGAGLSSFPYVKHNWKELIHDAAYKAAALAVFGLLVALLMWIFSD
jgi:hypothetical protein